MHDTKLQEVEPEFGPLKTKLHEKELEFSSCVKLANFIPVISKKGADLAGVLFEACTIDVKIRKEEVKEKVIGIRWSICKGKYAF